MFIRLRSFCVLFLVFLSAVASASENQGLLISATNVRMRKAPAVSAEMVGTLAFGTAGVIVEKSAAKESIAGCDDFWYQISTENGSQGWVYGGFARIFKEDERARATADLIFVRLENEQLKLEDLSQVYDFAANQVKLASFSADAARIELAYLQSIEAVLTQLSLDEKEPGAKHRVKDENQSLIYLHECAGRHFVAPESYWQLVEKYAAFPAAADDIAWAATSAQQQGETEGDPLALLARFENSHARYIEKFPNGRHVEKALSAGNETLGYVADSITADYFGENDQAERAESIEKLAGYSRLADKTPDSPAKRSFLSSLARVREKIGQ